MKKVRLILGGIAIGIINSLFAAGGGMLAVPMLTKTGLTQKEAQATAVSVILPLTVVTSVLYFFQGNLEITAALPYILPGIFGAIIGSLILKKIPDKILKKIFALFLIWAGVRMITK